ncbi:MAG TPA: shikimate kinase [Ferruginibacter sp.]|nr:shikimate kinase [Ferruginibacter sp.]
MRIYLIGFMGSGKSHWGRRWAATHEWPFYDLDDMITSSERLSVTDIFEQRGEEYFRMRETLTLRRTLGINRAIIACGGGTPCFHGNMEWMNEQGFTIYLSATPAYLLQQVMADRSQRPLLKNVNEAELLYFIQQKLAEREPYYLQAKLTLHTDGLSANSLDPVIGPEN